MSSSTHVETLQIVISAGIDASQLIQDRWSSGDLAGAVNELYDWATQAADHIPDDIPELAVEQKRRDDEIDKVMESLSWEHCPVEQLESFIRSYFHMRMENIISGGRNAMIAWMKKHQPDAMDLPASSVDNQD